MVVVMRWDAPDGVSASGLWISPLKVFQGGVFDEWGEVLLVAAFRHDELSRTHRLR